MQTGHVVWNGVVPLNEKRLGGRVLRVRSNRFRHCSRERCFAIRANALQNEEALFAGIPCKGIAENLLDIPDSVVVTGHDPVKESLPRRTDGFGVVLNGRDLSNEVFTPMRSK